MKITPRGKWVLVKPLIDENKENEFGLLVPATDEKEQKSQGTVESVGEEVKGIKKGDVVIYGAFAGENIKTNDTEYKLLLDEDIIAYVK